MRIVELLHLVSVRLILLPLLVESIRRFPPQEELCERMRGAGFEQVRHRNLSGGIAALHSGWRL